MARRSLTRIASEHYLKSRDFNGIRLDSLIDPKNESEREVLRQAIRDGSLEIVSSSWDSNPSIKRHHCPAENYQLACLDGDSKSVICVYPTQRLLRRYKTQKVDAARPFTARLQSGEPQLTYVPFDLAVLERYHRDPRYNFEIHNFGGHITVANEYYKSEDMPAHDQVSLESFGYGRDCQRQPVVVAFLRYLSALSPQHQVHW